MLEFEKPNYKITDYKINEKVESEFYGKFEIEPLERGFGITLGNALRRVMLSSLPGSAISSVRIDGVLHEFQTIEGVCEDVTTIILNLKKVAIKNFSNEEKLVSISAKEGVVTAGDIIRDSDIEILNPDLVIANVSKGGTLNMEMTISNGRGYIKSDDNKKLLDIKTVGVIATDSNFSPVEKVSDEALKTRVGQYETYDKGILEVWTNGTMRPEEVVALSSQILIEYFKVLTNLSNISDMTGLMVEKSKGNENDACDTPIEDLCLSVRAFNCLRNAEIRTLQDLTDLTEEELSKIRNLGKKSFKEILDKIEEKGLVLRNDNE